MPDPLWINASAGAPSYSASELRANMNLISTYGGSNSRARPGVRPGSNQLAVTLVGSTITVATGVAVLEHTSATGVYWAALTSAENHTLTVADLTNPRKDIVIFRVYDHDVDASGLRTARTEYLVGTPAGSPAEPTVPAGAIRLATIDVPASGGGSPVVTDRRPWLAAPGGRLLVRDQTERDALSGLYESLAVWRADRDWEEVYDGTAWRVQGVAKVSNFADLSAITNPFSGQVASNTADNLLYRHNGTSWLALPGLVDSRTLGGTTASVTFSTIPAAARSLRLEIQARGDTAATTTNLLIQFNGDTTNNYDAQSAYGQTTTAGAAESVAASAITMLEIAAASASANHAGTVSIVIVGHSGTSWIKTVDGRSASSFGTGAGTLITRKLSGRWRSTAAITSITVKPAAGNFVANSRLDLYAE